MKLLMLMPDNATWARGARKVIYTNAAKVRGHEVHVTTSRERLLDAIAREKPDVIVDHAMVTPSTVWRRCVAQHPDIGFISINHSAQAHTATRPNWVSLQETRINAARLYGNCWFGTVEDLPHIHERVVTTKAPVWLADHPARPKALRGPVRVVMSGRHDPIKDFPTALLAFREFSKHHPSTLDLLCPSHAITSAFCRSFRVEAQLMPLFPHGGWVKYLRDSAGLFLQPSLAESFNCAVAEAMQLGVPAITSHAIRFGYRRCASIEEMVNAMRWVVRNYGTASQESIAAGQSAARQAIDTFFHAIEAVKP